MDPELERVIICILNGEAIAARNPDAIIIDHGRWAMHRNGRTVRFSRGQFLLVALVFAGRGGTVSRDAIMEALYGDDEGGGPDDAIRLMDVRMCRIRRMLAPLDLGVVTEWGQGFRAVPEVVLPNVPALGPAWKSSSHLPRTTPPLELARAA